MPTSQEFLNVCRDCHAFCCTIVRPVLTNQERQRILGEGFPDHFIKIQDNIYEIQLGEKGRCPYLDKNNACLIQRVKPKFCKIWPIVPYIKNKKRGYLVIKCPLFFHISKKKLNETKKQAEEIPDDIIEHLWESTKKKKNRFKIFEYQEI